MDHTLTDRAGHVFGELNDNVGRFFVTVRQLRTRYDGTRHEPFRQLQIDAHILQQLIGQGVDTVELESVEVWKEENGS